MKRRNPLPLLLSALLLTQPAAHAFGGEDPINGAPWHHEDITRLAATDPAVGFSPDAADALAWHADYVDSYLYNPLWWAPGGLGRFKASLSTQDELKKLHFDDLFSSDQVRTMWRRYTSGTIAGLLWARSRGDINAAQNIVGAGLHAIQDFYSHSCWVDDPARRTQTYFDVPLAQRSTLTLYTGAYEKPSHLGIHDHGKYAPSAAILLKPGVSQLLDLASSGFSPLSNTPLIQEYKRVKDGVSVQPYAPFLKEWDIKVPSGVLYLAPPGIAVDNTWLAEIAVHQRGLTGITGLQLFNTAKGLAIRQSAQWLERIGKEMEKAGAGQFWKDVKTTGKPMSERTRAYEKFDQFPYTFMTAGEYPPPAQAGEEIFLRVQLKTSGAAFAGTNADIKLKADGKEFLLDYMPGAVPVLAHDDFEAGDDEVYTVGPFTKLPSEIELVNAAPGAKQILKALGDTFVKAGEKIADTALSLIAGHADHIGTRKKIWMPEELAQIGASAQPFTIDVDGKDEGFYRIHGTIRRSDSRASDDTSEYEIFLVDLECVKESKWDRGSNSDEPFVMTLLSALPGEIQGYRTVPFQDVDKGERRKINGRFVARVPNQYGVLNLPVCVMESDDEGEGNRQKLFDAFLGQVKGETDASERTFLATLDSARAADWKLQQVNVYAFSRNGRIRTGQVCDATPDRWIGGGESARFALDPKGFVDSGIQTDDLVADSAGTPEPGPVGADPNAPLTNAQMASLLDPFKGVWQTNRGTLLTIAAAQRTDSLPMLRGAAVQSQGGALAEEFYLSAEPGPTLKGQWTTQRGIADSSLNASGLVTLVLSADGKSFSGKAVLRSGNEIVYSGTRVADAPAGQTPDQTPGEPPLPEGFQKMKSFAVRLDGFRRGADNTVEALVTFYSASPYKIGIQAGVFTATIFDDDGLPLRSDGNLYRASGAAGEKPIPLPGTVWLEERGEMAKARFVFKPQFKITNPGKLTLREYSQFPIVFPLSALP